MNYNSVIPRLTSLILFILSIPFSQALAQTGTLKGNVVNEQSQSPLPNINIALENTRHGSATRSDGTYTLDDIPAGDYTVVASGVGYIRESETITVKPGESVVLNFNLTVATEELSEVTVTGQVKETYNTSVSSSSLKIRGTLLKTPQNIQVITDDLIRDQQIFNVVEGIARNVSGVHREEHWDNMYARIYMRGSKIPAFRNGMSVEMPWGPLAEHEVTVGYKDQWFKTLYTDQEGRVSVSLPWSGQYVIEAIYTEDSPGTFQEDDYEAIRHTATYNIPPSE